MIPSPYQDDPQWGWMNAKYRLALENLLNDIRMSDPRLKHLNQGVIARAVGDLALGRSPGARWYGPVGDRYDGLSTIDTENRSRYSQLWPGPSPRLDPSWEASNLRNIVPARPDVSGLPMYWRGERSGQRNWMESPDPMPGIHDTGMDPEDYLLDRVKWLGEVERYQAWRRAQIRDPVGDARTVLDDRNNREIDEWKARQRWQALGLIPAVEDSPAPRQDQEWIKKLVAYEADPLDGPMYRQAISGRPDPDAPYNVLDLEAIRKMASGTGTTVYNRGRYVDPAIPSYLLDRPAPYVQEGLPRISYRQSDLGGAAGLGLIGLLLSGLAAGRSGT